MSDTIADERVVARLKAELERMYGVRLGRVVLFGSRARGDHRDDSDYDVAVFLTDYKNRYDEIMRLARIDLDLFYETGAWVSAKPFRLQDYDSHSPLMREIRREGRTV